MRHHLRHLLLWSAVMAFSPLATAAAPEAFSSAKKIGPARGLDALGCKGGFTDLSGQCWKCPSGHKHDNIFLAPTNDKVCKAEGGRDNRKGTNKGKATGLLKTDCPKGAWLSTHDGGCYTCPSGFNHDILKNGNQEGVCWKDNNDRYAAAALMTGTVLCDKGGFLDLIDGGTCWTCPPGTPKRTAEPVTSQKACKSEACGVKEGRPCLVTERFPSCDAGLAEDFIENRCVPAELRVAACRKLIKALKDGKLPVSFGPIVDLGKVKAASSGLPKTQWATKLLADAQTFQAAYVENARVALNRATAAKNQVMAVFEADTFCEGAGLDSKLAAAGMRAVLGLQEPMITAYTFTWALTLTFGAQISQTVATDSQGNTGTFISVAPALTTNWGTSASLGVGVFRGKLADFEGWGYGLGGSVGPPGKPYAAGVDTSYTNPAFVIRGVGVSAALGAMAVPLDAYLNTSYSIKVGGSGK